VIYLAFCFAVFKIFRIPVNQWSLSTAGLGGIFGIVLLLLTMNYNHPFTTKARIYFAITPVLSGVRGRVIEVPVETNVPLKAGDVLFRIDPKPFEYVVSQKKAALAEAEQNVSCLNPVWIKQRLAQTGRRRNSNSRSLRMTGKFSYLKRRLSHKRRWTPRLAILRPHDRHWSARKPNRSEHALRLRRTSTA
jgi:multidrug resistance efflux pump